MAFTDDQLERYSRHLILKEIGVRGQKKLLAARVLVIGAGGLGSPAAMYLAAAGVGTIGIVDDDVVDLSNLQRQIIHGTGNVGMPKVESAAETVTSINPDVTVKPYHIRVSAGNIAELIAATMSSSTPRTISRRNSSSTTPAFLPGSRIYTVARCGSRASS